MAVDFHAHIGLPDPEAPPFLSHMFDVDAYLERQAETEIELTVLSYALHDLRGTPEELETAKAENDHLAGLVSEHPDRLAALAGIDPFGGDPWLAEAERALEAGCAGLCLPTSRNGTYLDAPEAEAALALAAERGVPVFLHPSASALDGRPGQPLVEAWVGLPVDTGVCLARMLLADTLSRHSGLRLVGAHCGGILASLLGRLDGVFPTLQRVAAFMARGGAQSGPPGGAPGGPATGLDTVAEGQSPPLALSLEGGLPSERTGQIYLDTATLHPAALRAAIEAVGVDRVVLGTDYPPAGESPAKGLELVNGAGLSDDDRDKVLSRNALELLGR